MVDDPKRPIMPIGQTMRLLQGQKGQRIPAAVVRALTDRRPITHLPTPQNTPVPAARHGVKMDEGYFWGWVPPPVRRRMSVNNERPILTIPTQDTIPNSTDPQFPIWLNNNYPPWTNPTYWSHPLDKSVDGCIPWYEIASSVGVIDVPSNEMYVIKGISYEVLGAAQGDVFVIRVFVGGSLAAEWEDISADAANPNPAYQYGINGYTREMPVNIIADMTSRIVVEATLRGPLSFDGTSPYFPGEPITTGNCLVRVVLNGWVTPLRERVSGGSRPTDIGEFGNLPLQDDQAGWQV